MNLVDVYITKIIEKPYEENGAWIVKVMTDCYGNKEEKTITCFSKKEIKKYKVGYSWLV